MKQKWEYKMTYLNLDTNTRTVNVLNDLGLQGWELVTMKREYGIFKRPKETKRRFLFGI